MRHLLRLCGVVALCMTCSLSVSAADQQTRIVFGAKNSDAVTDALRYVVSTLAGMKNAFTNNVEPNIEVLLYGVDTQQPFRFDAMLSADRGQETQAILPITDLDDFITDNLIPIGIDVNRDRRDRELYELEGDVYEGWMRYLSNPAYVVISKRKEDIPKGMPHPAALHVDLVKMGYLTFARLQNDANGIASRKAAFDKFQANTIEELQKLPSETREAFELRKASAGHFWDLISLWFSESKQFRFGMTIDQAKHTSTSQLLFSPLPNTHLQANFQKIGTVSSQFGAIKAPENAVLTMRGLVPIDADRKAETKRLWEMSRPVFAQKIQDDAKASDTEKVGRKHVSELLLDVLSESSQLEVMDGFLDIFPSGQNHTLVMGINIANPDKVKETISQLGGTEDGWQVAMDADKAGDVAIHRLTLGGDVPKALTDFYGPTKLVHFAVTEHAFWMSTGEQSLETLKNRLETVATAEPSPPTKEFATLTAKLQPLVKSMYDLSQEEDLGVLGLFQAKELLEQRRNKVRERRAEKRREEPSIADFKWQQPFIDALAGENDTVMLTLRLDENGDVVGEGVGYRGFLKAIGVVIGKYAAENLN